MRLEPLISHTGIGAAKGKQILKTDIVIDLSIVSTYISIMP
jgi:hypothetical protein